MSVISEHALIDTPSVHVQLKEMIADAVDNDRRLTETELFTQQMQKVCDVTMADFYRRRCCDELL